MQFSSETRASSRIARKTVRDITNMSEKENQYPAIKKTIVKRPATAPASSVIATAAPNGSELPSSRMRRPIRVSALGRTGTQPSTTNNEEVAAAVVETAVPATVEAGSVDEVKVPMDPQAEKLLMLSEQLRASETDFKSLLTLKTATTASKSAITDNKNQIQKLKSALKELLTKRDELIDNVLRLNGEMNFKESTHAQELGSFKEHTKSLQENIETNISACKSLSDNLKQLENELAASETARKSVEHELEMAQAQLESMQHKLSSTETALMEARSKLVSNENEISRLKEQVDRISQERQKAIETMESQLQNQSAACDNEKARLEQLKVDYNATITKLAVTEQQYTTSRQEVDRLMSEKEQAKEAMNAVIADREANAAKLKEMEHRLDVKETALNDTIKALMAGQEMHTQRAQELAAERDSAHTELAKVRHESEEIREDILKLRADLNDKEVELRLVSSELSHTKTCLEGINSELNTTRQRLMDITQAKAETSERLAVVEAEFHIFKVQSKLPNLDQIEKLCAMEADKVGMNSRVSAAEMDAQANKREAEMLRAQVKELTDKLHAGETARRKLHNEIQELKGNIRVFARVRPGTEAEGDCPMEISNEGCTITPHYPDAPTFHFDQVFSQRTSQEEVFSEVSNFVQSALDGYNVVLFAYGQTGAGKTHTMIGGKEEFRGVIPRSIEQILHTVNMQSTNGWRYELEASFLEIYNESIRDLLVEDSKQAEEDRAIRLGEQGQIYVSNLIKKPIQTISDVTGLMHLAEKNRSYARTDMNSHSSRSHSVFQLAIKGTLAPKSAGGKCQVLKGSLNLVDLAGSERLAKSNATGDRLRETQNINKSLSALCDVFTALCNKQSHVPYRNSKLTHLLQPCLSGDGKALVIVNLSPANSSVQESVCTLRFASMVSSCELGKAKRHVAVIAGEANTATTTTTTSSTTTASASSSSSSSTATKRPQTSTGIGRDEKRTRS